MNSKMNRRMSRSPQTKPGKLLTKHVFVMMAFALSVGAACAKDNFEWIVTNTHIGTGTYNYYLAENAVRIDNTGNGGIIVARAPTWQVSCYRPSEKLEYVSDLQKFDASAILPFIPKRSPSLNMTVRQKNSTSLQGLACERLLLQDGRTYWTFAAAKLAPQVSEVVARYFSGPDVGAVAVRILLAADKVPGHSRHPAKVKKDTTVAWMNVKNFESDTNEQLAVDMKSWKKVPFRSSDFDYPSGYKRTTDIKEVMISASNRKQLEEMIDMLGASKAKPHK